MPDDIRDILLTALGMADTFIRAHDYGPFDYAERLRNEHLDNFTHARAWVRQQPDQE